ncbi:leucine-rich repeat domain-containing protein [Baaleninema simplex]|uniref:leucine-rich repeat domain-containing protein n=1 Tax=Baaleninema simplex TaxID=2862350 RepID=UPI00036D9381|nr:leucine-rich repeat domain-containing protein [Baaleninema simplex]
MLQNSKIANLYFPNLYLSNNLIQDINPLVGSRYQKLDLSHNQIRNLPPLEIQVIQLHLDNNQIEDLKPIEALDRPERLVDLTVSGNQIRQLPSFAEMTDLTYIDLSNNQIEDIRPLATWVYDRERWQRMLTNPRGLLLKFSRRLDLANNQISDLSPLEDFEQPDSLTELIFKGNQIRQLPSFSEMTYLSFLDLSDNQIEDVSPLQSLETPQGWSIYIDLRNNQIMDAQPLSLVSRIYVLDLKGNPLVDETCPLPDLEERNCRF